ncbi:hypothetical protein SteCoe_25553 [Stentor coeruleus]|uniref:Globin family profile domain-containing protein n=1 Tax=Stentor coeruleus TaxID=5963 RepID=A0A1R2BF21_9CILI|nr:hypothetical protein SteCoe_25553 [Stentor coeruleus]
MNLFEKYGGADFWSDFLNDVYKRLTNSDLTRHHFMNKNISHIKEMLLGLLELTLVSDSHISEAEMKDSHKPMGITNEEFDEWVNIYRTTLQELGVADTDVTFIANMLSSYRSSIVADI